MKRLLLPLALAAAVLSAQAGNLVDQLAIQTWTLRNLNFEQTIEFAVKHGIKDLQVIGNHIDPNASKEEWAKKKAALDAAIPSVSRAHRPTRRRTAASSISPSSWASGSSS